MQADQDSAKLTQGAGSTRTNYALAIFLLGGGIIASAQLGKAFVAMPLIQQEMALPITIVSLIIATFATLGAWLGMGTGLIARRVGPRRSLMAGMCIMAAGSLAGAAAQSPTLLIASRILEGIGFLGVVVVIPGLIDHAASGRDRNFFFGLWGTFMPVGTALMLLMGPVLPLVGWRMLWISQAGVTLAYAVAAFLFIPASSPTGAQTAVSVLAMARNVLKDRPSVLLSAVFGLYTFQYFILAGFLPVILVTALGLTIPTATLFTAGVVTANVIGNICAGLLSRAGFPLWISMGASLTCYALTAPLIYSAGLPASTIALLSALTLGVAGLLPGSIFAAVPRLVPPELVTPTMGLIQQSSNIGQFLGPLAAGLFVHHFGWSPIPMMLIPMVIIGLCAVAMLRPKLAGERG